ncbi:MAG: 16S rRNA processing protein RimM [Chloroflexi bacterium]|nr:16S rRNA processing protein RimM [Chloroflexota bacterium]HOS79065.1 ribosome maturation factor RimM [Anaerolineae bacterium]HOV47022.1 ribosome maturation factor RimM [Anaerolineae bacterium]HQE98481.1 ribosome maturation factor RimM [Anaerolineae bacterium]HQJ10520.1 ribosome maturation factor RimM [Anaerolineae bacterium]
MPDKQPEPRYLAVGRILRPHGIAGELRVEILTDYPDRLTRLRHLYVGPTYRRYAVTSVRFHQGLALLRFAGVTDRNAAELLRGQFVWVALAEAIPLEEGEYYLHQLLGMQVSTEEGELLGEIVEVLDMPAANDVYVVHGLRGEVLIPAIREVILSMDLETRQMVIRPLPGLLSNPEEA